MNKKSQSFERIISIFFIFSLSLLIIIYNPQNLILLPRVLIEIIFYLFLFTGTGSYFGSIRSNYWLMNRMAHLLFGAIFLLPLYKWFPDAIPLITLLALPFAVIHHYFRLISGEKSYYEITFKSFREETLLFSCFLICYSNSLPFIPDVISFSRPLINFNLFFLFMSYLLLQQQQKGVLAFLPLLLMPTEFVTSVTHIPGICFLFFSLAFFELGTEEHSFIDLKNRLRKAHHAERFLTLIFVFAISYELWVTITWFFSLLLPFYTTLFLYALFATLWIFKLAFKGYYPIVSHLVVILLLLSCFSRDRKSILLMFQIIFPPFHYLSLITLAHRIKAQWLASEAAFLFFMIAFSNYLFNQQELLLAFIRGNGS